MAIKYENLLSPIQIGGVMLKNRMVNTAGTPHMIQGGETYPTEKWSTHIANRAKNGAAAVFINHLFLEGASDNNMGQHKKETSYEFRGHDLCCDLTDEGSHAYLCQMIDAIRYYESIAITQPPGKYPAMKGMDPGRMMMDEKDRDPEDMFKMSGRQEGHNIDHVTRAEIQEYIDTTVENAKILKMFGFEMFAIHCAYHNNPASEFWSTCCNTRTDEYGGSVKNRARLILDMFDALRQTLGKDFPLELLISSTGPGVSIPDTIELARMAKGKIDVFHIRHGYKDPQHPLGYNSTRQDPCPNLAAAAALKQALGDEMLIGVSAGLQNPDFSEKILKDKKADIICMSRAWICDPEYGKKLYEGRGEDVRPCVRCNKCHVPNVSDKFRVVCSVNPLLGFEDKIDRMIAPVEKKKKVGIVGGGPAGMQAAVTAAGRGHNVTLYERSHVLGGQLIHADYPSFKWPMADFKNYLISQVYKAGVNVVLNSEVTREFLSAQQFDEVIVAIGPVFKKADIPMEDGVKYGFPLDVYGDVEKSLPKNIVVIGGSETGTETGMYLAENGHNVTVLTRQGMLVADGPGAHFHGMFREAYMSLEHFSYDRYVQKYVSISKDGVTYINKDGHQVTVAADYVVFATGTAADHDGCQALYGAAPHTHYIGDCYRPGDLHKALTAGMATANQI